MKKILISVLCLLVLLIPGLTSCAKSPSTEGSIPLKFGCAYGLSGAMSYWALTHQRTFTVATEMINEKGGFVAGGKRYHWEVVFRDTKSDPAEALKVVQALIYQDGCKFISIHATGAVLASLPTLKESGVLNMNMSLPRQAYNGPEMPLGFAYCMDTYIDYNALYPWFKNDLGVKTLTYIVQDTESGKDSEKDCVEIAKNTGLNLLSVERVAQGTKDYYPQLTRVLKLNPDLIHMQVSPADNTLIVKQARELGYKGLMCMWSTDPKLLLSAVSAEALNGVFTDTNIVEATTQEMKDLYERHAAKYGADKWDPITWLYHDYFNLLTKAIVKADSVDPAKVAAAMEGMQFDTVMGPSFLGGKARFGRDSVTYVPVGVVGFKNGVPYQALLAAPNP